MWLTSGSIPQLSTAVVRSLVERQLIETESPNEVTRDISAVFEQYLRDDLAVSTESRQIAERRGAPNEAGRIKRDLARQRGLGLGEEAIDYLLAQLLEMLMHSGSVEEIFGEDHQLKLAMRGPLRAQFQAEDQLDEVVRKRMKHLQEGTSQWEIEYQRMREEVARRRL